MKNTLHNQSGIILIMVMLVTAILLSIALGFGAFILSDLRQAKQIDNSIVAYYAAEAGLERGLYLLRQDENSSIATLLLAYSNDTELSNHAKWNLSRSTSYEANFLRQRLYNGQSAKMYFLDRQSSSGHPGSLKLDWQRGGGGASQLQVIFTQLNPQQRPSDNAVIYYSDQNKILSLPPTGGNLPCFTFDDKVVGSDSTTPPNNYLVELRSLGTDAATNNDYIENVKVTAYDSNDCSDVNANTTAISNLTLRSQGNYNGARQEVVAQILPRDPLSGLLGFVLFSQADITKGY